MRSIQSVIFWTCLFLRYLRISLSSPQYSAELGKNATILKGPQFQQNSRLKKIKNQQVLHVLSVLSRWRARALWRLSWQDCRFLLLCPVTDRFVWSWIESSSFVRDDTAASVVLIEGHVGRVVLIHKALPIFISVKRLLLLQLNSLTKWGFKLCIIIGDSDPITSSEMCCADAFWWDSHIIESQGAPNCYLPWRQVNHITFPWRTSNN